jgi:hypothetical protein
MTARWLLDFTRCLLDSTRWLLDSATWLLDSARWLPLYARWHHHTIPFKNLKKLSLRPSKTLTNSLKNSQKIVKKPLKTQKTIKNRTKCIKNPLKTWKMTTRGCCMTAKFSRWLLDSKKNYRLVLFHVCFFYDNITKKPVKIQKLSLNSQNLNTHHLNYW